MKIALIGKLLLGLIVKLVFHQTENGQNIIKKIIK